MTARKRQQPMERPCGLFWKLQDKPGGRATGNGPKPSKRQSKKLLPQTRHMSTRMIMVLHTTTIIAIPMIIRMIRHIHQTNTDILATTMAMSMAITTLIEHVV